MKCLIHCLSLDCYVSSVLQSQIDKQEAGVVQALRKAKRGTRDRLDCLAPKRANDWHEPKCPQSLIYLGAQGTGDFGQQSPYTFTSTAFFWRTEANYEFLASNTITSIACCQDDLKLQWVRVLSQPGRLESDHGAMPIRIGGSLPFTRPHPIIWPFTQPLST